MKTLAVIQARMNSTRLPGKVLFSIEDRPMLWHVIERTKQASQVDQVIVATSSNKEDDSIEDFCQRFDIPCYRGSEADVLDRFYQAVKPYRPESVVRITGDCPLIDPEVVDKIIREFNQTGTDYASNTIRYTYPDGLDAEVFSFKALERAWKEAEKPSEREHVTPYIRLSGKFSTCDVLNDTDLSEQGYHWSVDKDVDMAFAREVFKHFKDRPSFRFKDVLFLLDQNPALKKLNENQITNEGYYKSLYQQAKAESAKKLCLEKSVSYLERSKKVIPGCAQTFSKSTLQYVQGVSPVFLASGKGCRVKDVDGNEYIDYVQGLLPNLLGYANDEVNAAVIEQMGKGHSFSLPHPLEVELAEKLCELIPCAEMVRFGKNGSDVTAGAVRAARAYTGRERVAVCGYHGWQDWYIGSTTRNAGIPVSVCERTHTFPYNDLEKLEGVLQAFPNQFAAIIMEPFNFVEPKEGYLQGVKTLAEKYGALLIFDEICTGFMFGLGGAQKMFGVKPDLACFGKALGNGFPIAAVVGRRDVMRVFEEIFFSFTAAGETSAMAAALKVLSLLENTDVLKKIEDQGRVLKGGFNTLAKEAGLEKRFQAIGRPQWSLLKFMDPSGKDSLLERSLFQQEAIKRGILLLVTHNMSSAHDSVSTEQTLEAYAGVFKTLAQWLSDPHPETFLQGSAIQPVFRVR